ncbi:MAG: hypothetical protein Ct9H300mP23_09260 [Nitrospinota bacterium]|nr:MAG: hypothetical protein Ct9H300mP23_09260 [Nitrospinota bacterium]
MEKVNGNWQRILILGASKPEKEMVDTVTALDALLEKRGESQITYLFVYRSYSSFWNSHSNCQWVGLLQRV